VYGTRAEKPLQIADFAMKQTNICRLSGDINNFHSVLQHRGSGDPRWEGHLVNERPATENSAENASHDKKTNMSKETNDEIPNMLHEDGKILNTTWCRTQMDGSCVTA